MKHRIIIEYETPDGVYHKQFNGKIAEMMARKAVSDYLYGFEELRRQAMEAAFKITSSTNESYIEN